jgi:hypothetical protein
MTGNTSAGGPRIVVSFDDAVWSVSIEPASISEQLSYWTNHELAMAKARLLRLEHGFKIVDQGQAI